MSYRSESLRDDPHNAEGAVPLGPAGPVNKFEFRGTAENPELRGVSDVDFASVAPIDNYVREPALSTDALPHPLT